MRVIMVPLSAKCLVLIVYLFVKMCCVVRGRKIEFGPCNFQYLEPCSNETIKFYLFTSDRPYEDPVQLDNINPKVPHWIDLTYDNKMIIHGYAGNLDFNATKLIRMAYLAQPNHNVLVVDWGDIAKLPCYPSAVFNTKQAGECTATFLIGMQANHPEFNTRDLHGIGFSLGAHVVSFTSNALEKAIGTKFRRITGLDPALPFFATARPQFKLDSSDADFVDVIHTNAGVFGKLESCGHVDFYVNGGQKQPTCVNAKNQPYCSHVLAPVYFSESINSDVGFWGIRCSSYFQYVFGWCDVQSKLSNDERIVMGEHCPKTSEGVYFVNTKLTAPFAMGNKTQFASPNRRLAKFFIA